MVTSYEEMLANTVLFRDLSVKDRQKFAGYCTVHDYKAGDEVTRQGELGTGLFIIVSGAVEVIHNRGQSDEQTLASLKAGEFFGEMALFLERPRNATIVATEPTSCLTLLRWDFKDHAMEAPAVLWNMLEVLAQRLAGANEELWTH